MKHVRMMSLVSIVLLVTVSVLAQAGAGRRGMDPRGGGNGGLDSIVDGLDLTKEQKKVWKEIKKELEKSTESTRATMREMRDEGVDRNSDEAREVMAEMRTAMEKAEKDLLEILDEEQTKKFEENKASMQERRRGRGQGGQGRSGRRGRGY